MEAAEFLRSVYGCEAALEELPGERDRNFSVRAQDGDRYVLKLIDPQADAANVACQVGVLLHLAEQDPSLPVPRLCLTRTQAPVAQLTLAHQTRSALLISHLPGQLLAQAQAPGSALGTLGALMARLDRALRGFFHPSLAQTLVWDVRRLPELAELVGYLDDDDSRRLVGEVVARFQACEPRLRGLPSQAIHGDLHGANVLVDSASLRVTGIIDFGDMIHAPRVFEPAVAMAELLIEGVVTPSQTAALLQGYVSGQALEAAEVDALYDVILARHAVSLLVHAWRLRHDPAGAAALGKGVSNAACSLEQLLTIGRASATEAWHETAGTLPPAAALGRRRARALGAGAELFYEQPLHIVRGEDVWLFDAAGRRYLDVYNNVPHVGHAHPTVVAAVQRQVGLLATHTRYLHETVIQYAEQLTARLPPTLDTCIFVNSGSEANDVAWRMAEMITGRRGALIMEHAYHGITHAVAALTPATGGSVADHVACLRAPPRGVAAQDVLSAADLAAAAANAEQAILGLRARGHEPAALFLDSALTSNGIFDPPPAWSARIVDRARAAGALLIGDEVQYGLGRSGSHLWGFERRGLSPDIVTLGKPIGNGFPMGVVVASRALVEEFQARCGFFSTFGGNAVAAAAGLAVLQVLEREALQANALKTGGELYAGLRKLAQYQAGFGEVRGSGLLLGLEIQDPEGQPDQRRARRLVNVLCAEHGILTGLEGPAGNVLKLRPPMSFRQEHAARLLTALAAAADSAAMDVGASLG
jgi:4-aminobutyrate aminotransferase-like enzyme/aminoglycoside phosphotransferase (APT) family kinase protein